MSKKPKFKRDVYAEPEGDGPDCAVRALAVAADIPYSVSYKAFARAGRKPARRTHGEVLPIAWRFALGYTPMPVDTRSETARGLITLAGFVKRYPTGRFIVGVKGHALAVVDGVVHDWVHKPRRYVHRAHRIELD